MAQRVPEEQPPTYAGGLESWLDALAWLLAAGVLLLAVVLALVQLVSGLMPGRPWGVLILFAGVLNALSAWGLFRGLAEIIRLLKVHNGLRYGGQLSRCDDTGRVLYRCSACGQLAHATMYCEHCQARFED